MNPAARRRPTEKIRLISGVLLSALLLISILAVINASTQTEAASDLEAALAAEPLIQQDSPISRSFSNHLLQFGGEQDGLVTQTMTWYPNGTVAISDDKGSNIVLAMDLTDAKVTLLASSLIVDQRVVGEGFQYDILWRPVSNGDGQVDKYKFDIRGVSDNERVVKFDVKTDKNMLRSHGNSIIGISPNFHSDNATIPQGVRIDWSDAVAQGNPVDIDIPARTISLQVGRTFSIDPVVDSSLSVLLSPYALDYYEGERRIVKVGSVFFVFYYDGSNIVYRTSTNDGTSWSGKTSLSTGSLNYEFYRFTVASWIYLSNDLITLVYWKQAGTNTEFWAKTCAVNVASLINCSTFSLFTKPNHSACGGTGVCAAAAVASDVPANPSSGSKIYAAIRYLSPGNCGAYCYRIMYSTNGGTSWTTSLAEQPVTTATRIPVVLTELSSGEMLFAYASYQDAELKYRTGTGTSWSGESSTSGMGMGTSTVKHISADSDVEQQAYVTGLSSGISGNLKVTTWTNTGSFGGVTTASSSPSHSLPAMTITPEGMMRIYTISGGKIYETKKVYTAGSWNPSVQVFPTGLNTANQLTAAITSSAALWTENTSTPYKIYFDKDPLDPGTGPAFQEDWEFHPGQGYLGTRAWIKILNPSITNCANLNPNCLYESVIAAYDGGSPTSDRGAVGSGWFKWKNAAGSGEVWLAFLYANFDKKYVSYKKTQQWTSFGVERNFVVNYQFEDSDGDDFWQRSVCTADPCSNGIVLQQDTVKFDDFDSSAQTRISAWTTHNTVQLGAGTTPAQFRDWKMFNYFHDPPIRWEPINGFGPYCTVDPVYYVHSHPTNLYHMGPPVVTGEIDNTGNCIGAPIPDIFQ